MRPFIYLFYKPPSSEESYQNSLMMALGAHYERKRIISELEVVLQERAKAKKYVTIVKNQT